VRLEGFASKTCWAGRDSLPRNARVRVRRMGSFMGRNKEGLGDPLSPPA
jgi:hypothetical protein